MPLQTWLKSILPRAAPVHGTIRLILHRFKVLGMSLPETLSGPNKGIRSPVYRLDLRLESDRFRLKHFFFSLKVKQILK